MARTLQANESLLNYGVAALRAPNGTLLEGISKYIIAPTIEIDAALAVPVAANEKLVMAGVCTLPGQKQAALERYNEALCAGFRPSLPEGGTETLYIKVNTSEINPSTGMLKCEETTCRNIATAMAEQFKDVAEKVKTTSQKKSK